MTESFMSQKFMLRNIDPSQKQKSPNFEVQKKSPDKERRYQILKVAPTAMEKNTLSERNKYRKELAFGSSLNHELIRQTHLFTGLESQASQQELERSHSKCVTWT